MPEITPDSQLARVNEFIKGYNAANLIGLGIQLGLFKALREAGEAGLPPGELAEGLGLHAPYVDIWCRTGYAWEVLEDAGDGRFRLAPFMDTILLERGHPRYMGAFFTDGIPIFATDFQRYPESFRSGGTYRFQEHGEAFSASIGEMLLGVRGLLTRNILPGIPGLKDKLANGCDVLDVGTGAGGLLLQIAKAYPNCRVTGVDIDEHGVRLAQRAIEQAGLQERARAVLAPAGGTWPLADQFDVAVMCEVLHEVRPEWRPDLIGRCAAALRPGGTLVILDETFPTDLPALRAPEAGLAVQTAWTELIWGNSVPTEAEQNALLSGAGFEPPLRQQLAGFTILATRKGPA